MADSSGYGERYAAQYAEGGFETQLVAVRRRRVLASLRKHPHRAVLEIGCGLEPLFEHLDDYDSYTLVEPVPAFSDRARRLAGDSGRISVLPGRLQEVAPALDARYDFVILSSLLHEVPDPDDLLSAVHRVCDEQSVVHVNVPNVRSFHRLLALEMGLIDDVFEPSETERRFHRQTRFDRDALVATLDRAGFRVLECGTYFVKPLAHHQLDALLRQGIVDASIVDGLERMIRYMPDLGSELYVDAVAR